MRQSNSLNPFTLALSDRDKGILESYCKQTMRTKADVLREFVRSLESQVEK